MTDSLASDLDELDRACAEAMGFHLIQGDPSRGGWHLNERGGLAGMPQRSTPSPTRSWEDFGALLLWCAEKGLEPMVRYSNFNERGNEWHAVISKGTNSATQISRAGPDPRVALCAAVKAWKASLTEAPRRGA